MNIVFSRIFFRKLKSVFYFWTKERKEVSEKSYSGNLDFTIALPADCVD